MTDLKFSILEKLYFAEHRQMNKVDLQNELIKSFSAPDVHQAFKDLHEDNLIDCSLTADVAKLVKNGRIIYESVKEERQRQAECKQRELDAEQRALKSEQLATESNALSKKSIRVTKISNIVAIGSIIVTLLSIAIAFIQFFF